MITLQRSTNVNCTELERVIKEIMVANMTIENKIHLT